MIDIFLLIVVIILAIVLIGLNIYLMIYYSHPADRGIGEAIWPKIVVVYKSHQLPCRSSV
jgi:hypothetical protein